MTEKQRSSWFWIPSLYFAEGLPYVLVMTLSVIMYKRLGISNAQFALYTSWLYLPWVIKPLWSPLVEIFQNKRFWILLMQLVIGAGLAGVAFSIPAKRFFQYTLAFFWLLALSSATHDIAADGFYMLALTPGDQSFFVGIRSTFYRFAMLAGQGLLVILAGSLETATGLEALKVEVQTKVNAENHLHFTPQDYKFTFDSLPGFSAPEKVEVALQPIPCEERQELVRQVEQWNISHGFYPAPQKQSEVSNPGWWNRKVILPFEEWLRRWFVPKERPTTGVSGNIALIPIRLKTFPGNERELVMNFGRLKGNQSISLLHEYRFIFRADNWDKPAFAVVQIDSKLKEETRAVFVGRSGNIRLAWSVVFAFVAVLFLCFSLYHRWALPRPQTDLRGREKVTRVWSTFAETFVSFFRKGKMGAILLFLLLYRLAESQLVKLAGPFLLDAREVGGLGLSTGDVGWVYGTAGMLALTAGGIWGGVVVSRKGLKYWLWWMALAINLPNLSYLLLSVFMPDSLWWITAAVVLEQFGYGFGFTAYLLYAIYISEGQFKTAHYAIATGFMALGMMIPGMMSGWLQEIIGYRNFFGWVMLCTLPIFLVLPRIRIDEEFGKKAPNDRK